MSSEVHLCRVCFLLPIFFLGLSLGAALPEAYAQSSEEVIRLVQRLPAAGPVMVGYAGAGIGGVAEAGALYTNPAGLGYYEATQAAGGMNALLASDASTYHVSNPDPSTTAHAASLVPASGSYVYRFPTVRGSLVLGAGFNQVGTYQRRVSFEGQNRLNSITETFQPFEYDVTEDGQPVFFSDLPFIAYEAGAIEFFPEVLDEDVYPFEPAAVPGTTLRQRGEVRESGHLRELHLGGAIQATRRLMVGLSLNVAFGRYESEQVFEEEDALGENQPEDYIVLRGGERYEGFERVRFEDTFAAQVAGAHLRAGLSYTVISGMRVGATLETPGIYEVENTFSAYMETFFQDGQSLSYSEASGEAERQDFTYRLRTPWRLGLGFLVDAAAAPDADVDMQFSGDIELVDWSQLELRSGEETDLDYSEENSFIEEHYNLTFNLRLGAQLGLGALALRGGLALQRDPRSTELSQSDETPYDQGRLYLTAGLAYQLNERVQLNAGWMQERFEDRRFPYTDPLVTSPPVDEDIQRNHFVFGVTYVL